MLGVNIHEEINYLAEKLELPYIYVKSMFNFLDNLVLGGLNNRESAREIVCYQYQLNKRLGEQVVNHYFKVYENIV